MQPERADMNKDLGALSGSRASTEPSSTVSALTGFDPARWRMRETAHLNGGREWFGYEHQCIEQPRLRRMDKYTRADRSVVSAWRVDGEDCASLDVALQKLSAPPLIGGDEMGVLRELRPEFMSKAELDALDIDWRNHRHSLSQKGLIWWEAGKVRLTAIAIEARQRTDPEEGLDPKGESAGRNGIAQGPSQ